MDANRGETSVDETVSERFIKKSYYSKGVCSGMLPSRSMEN